MLTTTRRETTVASTVRRCSASPGFTATISPVFLLLMGCAAKLPDGADRIEVFGQVRWERLAGEHLVDLDAEIARFDAGFVAEEALKAEPTHCSASPRTIREDVARFAVVVRRTMRRPLPGAKFWRCALATPGCSWDSWTILTPAVIHLVEFNRMIALLHVGQSCDQADQPAGNLEAVEPREHEDNGAVPASDPDGAARSSGSGAGRARRLLLLERERRRHDASS